MLVKQGAKLHGHLLRFSDITRRERVIMERNTVDYRNEKKRPVSAAFGFIDVATVVNRKERMSSAAEVWEGISNSTWVRGLPKHEGHARTKEDDIGILIV